MTPVVADLLKRIFVQDPVLRFSIDEVLSHPWLKSECAIPHRLPPWTMDQELTNNYIARFLPERFGGEQKHVMSVKDYDRDLRKYRNKMLKEKPVVKPMPGPKDGAARNIKEIIEHADLLDNDVIRAE